MLVKYKKMKSKKDASWICPFIFATVGLGIGAVLGGGKLVRVYDWQTEWTIDAPLATVYQVMTRPEEQDRWWPSMQVARVEPVAGLPDGRIIEYRVRQAASVARLVPPFKIISVTEDIEKERRLRSVVTGDLIGVLETLLYARPEGGTSIVFHWYVRVPNPALNLLGFLFASMFKVSHDHVMQEGEVGLQRYCKRRCTENVNAAN